jgi:hypothetical protein
MPAWLGVALLTFVFAYTLRYINKVRQEEEHLSLPYGKGAWKEYPSPPYGTALHYCCCAGKVESIIKLDKIISENK